jgi:hypothetical protein
MAAKLYVTLAAMGSPVEIVARRSGENDWFRFSYWSFLNFQ